MLNFCILQWLRWWLLKQCRHWHAALWLTTIPTKHERVYPENKNKKNGPPNSSGLTVYLQEVPDKIAALATPVNWNRRRYRMSDESDCKVDTEEQVIIMDGEQSQ